jgi:chorismate mutase
MSPTPEQTLEQHRARIDALDTQLIALLKERIGVVKQVAALKAEHWPGTCHIRPGREGRMHQRVAAEFKDSDFPAAAALAIWRQIIGASTHVESPLHIAVTSAEQAALAREYFGVTASITPFLNLADALANTQRTVLLATTSDLPVVRAVAPALKIFGALPLQGAEPTALALAEITPEPSGDDVSYYLREGRIETQPGFAPNDQWLGAHPRPITE